MGLFFRSTRASDDLLERGLRGKATVEHVWMNRFGFQANVSRKTALIMMRGEESPIRKKVRLRVELPGRAVHDVTTRVTAPLLKANWLLAGSVLEVMVDPNYPERVAVDWNGSHQQGSLRDLVADNPTVAAAMEGMGLDPENLAEAGDADRPPEPGQPA